LPVAEEEMLSPLAPSSAWGEERVFSSAAGVGLAALETHQGANTTRAKKPHQGIFSKNRRLRFSAMWAKWSGTHQDRSGSWWKSVLGSPLDANGNTLADASGKQYTWDFENRLTQAIVPGTNGGTTTFKYDPFGHRIQKSGPLGTTNYLYDGPNDIEEVDGTGNGLARYTDGQRIDEPLAELRSGNTNFYEQDGLGSVVSLSNGTGTLSGTYIYDSFGNLTASTGTVTNPFRYTGREFDQETGIYYYRARYYGQNIGRLNSEDPLRFTAGVNFYAYTWNNPANYSDPFGLCPPRVANHITCDTVLPNGQTVGDWVRQLSNGINQAAQDASTSTPDGPSPVLTPDLIAQQVYSSTNFRNMFGGPGANYPFLGDVGNFAYGAVSANIGVPLWGAEMVGGGYSLFKHPSADWGWPWGMDPSAQVQVPAGYKAKCTK